MIISPCVWNTTTPHSNARTVQRCRRYALWNDAEGCENTSPFHLLRKGRKGARQRGLSLGLISSLDWPALGGIATDKNEYAPVNGVIQSVARERQWSDEENRG
jgi:hypothetical protein